MLEETGTVVATDAEWAWVETQPRSACSHCGTGTCSTSVVAKLFGTRRNRLRVSNVLGAAVGQQVVIGIPDEVLVAASLRAYLLPPVAMLLGAGFAAQLDMAPWLQACMAAAGLTLGFLGAGRSSETKSARERYAPRLLRSTSPAAAQIELSELMRSRT